MIIGKTHVPELMATGFTESPTFGVTRNPWDPHRTSGGSSGGSATAVAAGLVSAAIGTDGAGSIRIPAACCGLFGLKTQRGRIPTAPDVDPRTGMTVFRPADAHGRGRRAVHGRRPRRRPVLHRGGGARRPAGCGSRSRSGPAADRREGRRRAARRGATDAAQLRDLGHEVVEREFDWG